MSECLPVRLSEDAAPVTGEQQVELFSVIDVEGDGEIVRSAKEFLHTGKIVLRDRERVEKVVRLICEGHSVRAIMRQCGVGWHAIQAIRDEAEKSGKLATLKQRLARSYGIVAEMSAENMIEALAAGKVPANVLAMMGGVATDKHLVLTGEASVIVEHKEGPTEEQIRKGLEAWVAKAKRIQGTDTPVLPGGDGGGQ
jgi:hypothetical protein